MSSYGSREYLTLLLHDGGRHCASSLVINTLVRRKCSFIAVMYESEVAGELLRFCVKSEGCRSPKVDFSDSLFCGRGAGVGRILFFLYAYFYCNFLISFFLEKSIELFPHGKEHLYIPAYHLIKLSVCFFETQMFSFYDSVLVIIPVYMYNAAYKYRHTHARTHARTHTHL